MCTSGYILISIAKNNAGRWDFLSCLFGVYKMAFISDNIKTFITFAGYQTIILAAEFFTCNKRNKHFVYFNFNT